MKKFTTPVLNLILAIGIFLILAGAFCAFQFFTELDENLPISSVLICIFGAVLFYVSFVSRKNAFLFFSGLYVFFLGVLSFFLTLKSFPNIRFEQIWPLIMVVCSVCLFFTCLYKYRKIRTVYVVPALLILLLGGLFLLFSLGLIRFSFVSLFAKWWPLFLIAFGGFFVTLFLYQQTPDNHFPFEAENSADYYDAIDEKKN